MAVFIKRSASLSLTVESVQTVDPTTPAEAQVEQVSNGRFGLRFWIPRGHSGADATSTTQPQMGPAGPMPKLAIGSVSSTKSEPQAAIRKVDDGYVLDLQLQVGTDGEDGKPGINGVSPPAPAAPAAPTIELGDVTTSSTTAGASMRKTSTGYALDLVLQKGKDGKDGVSPPAPAAPTLEVGTVSSGSAPSAAMRKTATGYALDLTLQAGKDGVSPTLPAVQLGAVKSVVGLTLLAGKFVELRSGGQLVGYAPVYT